LFAVKGNNHNLICSRRVYGRRVLPIRVCASPHRDRKQEEEKVSKSHGVERTQLVVKEETPAQYGGPSTDAANSTDYLGSLDQMFFIPVGSRHISFAVDHVLLMLPSTGQQL
jgi:hypothetical protein